MEKNSIDLNNTTSAQFCPDEDIIFDLGDPLPEHPNGIILELIDEAGNQLLTETYFSIGGGFIMTLADISQLVAPIKMELSSSCGYPFDSANSMMQMSTRKWFINCLHET